MMMTGMTSGSDAFRAASQMAKNEARLCDEADRAKEIAVDHQAEADQQPRHDAAEEEPADRDVADRAVDHRHDARRHQIGDGRRRRRSARR